MDVLELAAPQHSGVSPAAKPRLILEDHIDWAIDLAKRRYSNRWDFRAAEMWFRNIVLKQPMVFLPIRTEDAFCITLISVIPWLPTEWEANVALLCADEGKMWQALPLLRESVAWAEYRKCVEWRLSSETEYDFEPLARRLGAVPLKPRYCVRFVNGR